MINASIVTEVSIPGSSSIKIQNIIEGSATSTAYVDLPGDPGNIKSVNFNKSSVLKLLIVKTKDSKYAIQEEKKEGSEGEGGETPVPSGDQQPEPKFIKYNFKGKDEAWLKLEGPLFAFGTKMVESLNDDNKIEKMYFKKDFRKETVVEVIMFEDVVTTEEGPSYSQN